MLMSLAALGYVIADVAADGLTVQYAQSFADACSPFPVCVSTGATTLQKPGGLALLASGTRGASPLRSAAARRRRYTW